MTRPLRYEPAGTVAHVTNRGNEQQNIFRDDDDRETFLKLLGKSVTRFRWLVSSHTLMTNHFHLTVETTEDDSLSRGMHWLDGQYAQFFNRRYRRAGHLWQGTYGCQLIEKETHFLNVSRYVVLNSVRAGLSANAAGYPWSSYRATAGLEPAPPWLACEEVLSRMGDTPDNAHAGYEDFVATGLDVNPWTDLIGQMFLGSKEWTSEMRRKLGDVPLDHEHPLSQRRVGRPSAEEVFAVVAAVTGSEVASIKKGRGGRARMIAAWIGFHECLLRLTEIAAVLGLRSGGAVTNLVRQCERACDESAEFRRLVDKCVSTLRSA